MRIQVRLRGERQAPATLVLTAQEAQRGGVCLYTEEGVKMGYGIDLTSAIADVHRQVAELNAMGVQIEDSGFASQTESQIERKARGARASVRGGDEVEL